MRQGGAQGELDRSQCGPCRGGARGQCQDAQEELDKGQGGVRAELEEKQQGEDVATAFTREVTH